MVPRSSVNILSVFSNFGVLADGSHGEALMVFFVVFFVCLVKYSIVTQIKIHFCLGSSRLGPNGRSVREKARRALGIYDSGPLRYFKKIHITLRVLSCLLARARLLGSHLSLLYFLCRAFF